ncbi:MAG: oligosaccharide flippase family protein, partial [Bacteroidetes bacterium]|nr:oligosaccharide flippase family protein [Bacteroidota bacterium]
MLSLDTKFSKDIGWNVASFGVVGVSGILINIFILWTFNSAALGVFNQLYAIYILTSQLAAGGFHQSVQSFIPRVKKQLPEPNALLSTGLILGGLQSLLIIGIAFLLKDLPAMIFDSPEVGKGYLYILPGLFFFTLNKIFLAYHNGFRRMKTFAFFQGLRGLLVLLIIIVYIFIDLESALMASVLSVAEIILFVPLTIYTLRYWNPFDLKGLREWFGKHFNFGIRALIGNVLLDLNLKVDVIMLGIFLSDTFVGIYSFSATIAEGIRQLTVILRNNINPIISNTKR